jgi:hypothetical protein
LDLLTLGMKIVESKLLTRVSDVVYSASKGNKLARELLSWRDLALPAIPLNICGDREGRTELVGVWLRILGLPEFLDMSRSKFIVLLGRHTHRVSTDFEHA